MKQTIHISPLWCDAIIGIYPHERSGTQPICLHISAEIDAARAIATDAITNTIDYERLARQLKDHAEGHSYQLLETLLAKLLEETTKFPEIISASITIDKPKALEQMGATVSLSAQLSRENTA